jgi:CheY-like chemotaxis protein
MTIWNAASNSILHVFNPPQWPPESRGGDSARAHRFGESEKIRVIVIDDESLIAETVVEILKAEGFEATAVSSGLSAIELAKIWSPDVVLSDVIMPGLNGIETGTRIREVAPSCKVILFSGQAATVDLLEEARQYGHRFDILAKPIKPEQLVSAIRAKYSS